MYRSTKARQEPDIMVSRPAAVPVTFSQTAGLFQPVPRHRPARRVAALFVSPWGYDEMCTRKFWRVLAEELSDAGIASLRFDYPGTGDALDPAENGRGLDLWRDSVLAAAQTLRDLTGITDLLLIGQGLGAALAYDACNAIGHARGLALLAPVLSGRAYLREMTVWSHMMETRHGSACKEQCAGNDLHILGLTMPGDIAAGIRGIDLTKAAPARAGRFLVLARPDRTAEMNFQKHLESLGATVEIRPFDGYDRLVCDLTFSTPSDAAVATVVAWAAADEAPPSGRSPAGATLQPSPVPLHGDGFVETPVRFGDNDRLYGILCEPAAGERKGATVLMLTTAYERMAGFGRVATDSARDLARSGIASLRFDAANVGDSPPVAGAPDQILYTDAQHDDVDAAMAFLEDRDLLPFIVAGRCSGGYLAFRTAARDTRPKGVVAVNPYVLYWNPDQSLEELLLFVPQRLGTYGVKVFQLATWKRIFNGEVNLKYGVINTCKSLGLKLAGPLLDLMPALSRENREVHGAFQTILAHRIDVSLMYSEGDVGLEHFRIHFGADGAKLENYPNVRFGLIPQADHNISNRSAREVYKREMTAMALKFPPKV